MWQALNCVTGHAPNILRVFVTTLALIVTVPADARVATGVMPVMIQVSNQPVCQDRPPFGIGNYTPSLQGQDLSCWMRYVRLRKISVAPLAEGVNYVVRSGPITQRDPLGFSSDEWINMSDAEVLAVFLDPKKLNNMIDQLNKGVNQAFVPMHLLGQFVTTAEKSLSPAFGIAYPACKDFVPGQTTNSAQCTAAYHDIRSRIAKAGFGQSIKHGNLDYNWLDLGIAIGRSPYFNGFPRAQWLAFQNGTVYTDRDGSLLVEIAKAGLPSARRLLAKLSNTCSGTRYVYVPMNRYGISMKTAADWAVQLGDGEAALTYGKFLKNGTCGAIADRKASFDYIYKAAQMGHAPALYELATLYNNDETYGRSPRDAIAAFNGMADADPAAIATLEKASARFDSNVAREGLVQDVASVPPNTATIRAVMLRELRYAYENYDGGLQNSLSQLFGNIYSWDESKGRLENFQNGNNGMSAYLTQEFIVTGTSCLTIAGRKDAYQCRANLSIYMNAGFGNLKIADNIYTPVFASTEEYIFENGQWRSPMLRQKMLSGLRAPTSRASQSSPGQSALCRSLNAGVAAAGGNSTTKALNPNTWGC